MAILLPRLLSHTDVLSENMRSTRLHSTNHSGSHGNSGWLDYDRSFRQQATADPSIQWNTLVPGSIMHFKVALNKHVQAGKPQSGVLVINRSVTGSGMLT